MITAFQRLTRHYTRWIFLFLLAIFIGSLILWGGYGMGDRGFSASASRPVILSGRRVDPRKFDAYKRMMLLISGQERRLSSRDAAWFDQQVVQQMVLSEKARQWGLMATDREVGEQARRFFQKNGRFDDAAYSHFLEEVLAPRRLTETDFEKLIRDDIVIHKLIRLVASTARITSHQTQAFVEEITQKATVQLCRFNMADFIGQVHPTPEQLAAFFQQHGDQFRTPEKRRVAYVVFPMDFSKEQAAPQEIQEYYDQHKDFFMENGKPRPLAQVSEGLRAQLTRKKASQKAVNQATEFTVKLVPESGKAPPSFDALAAEWKLPVQQFPFFSENEPLPGISTMAFNSAAFKLTGESPVSDPVPGGNSVYVMMLKEIQPSRPLSYDEAKGAVRQALITNESLKMAQDKGREARNKLLTLLDQGKTFDQAAASLGIKTETIKDISIKNRAPQDPEENYIWSVALEMARGETGEFLPNATGGFFIYCVNRENAKPEEIAQLGDQVRQMYAQAQQRNIVQDFIAASMSEALGPQSPPSPPVQ